MLCLSACAAHSHEFELWAKAAVGTLTTRKIRSLSHLSVLAKGNAPLSVFANLDTLRRWMRAGTELGACRSFVPPSATAMGRRKYYEDDGGARGAPKVPSVFANSR